MSIKIKRTNSDNADFQKLVTELEIYLTGLDEEAHNECKEYNKLEPVFSILIIMAPRNSNVILDLHDHSVRYSSCPYIIILYVILYYLNIIYQVRNKQKLYHIEI